MEDPNSSQLGRGSGGPASSVGSPPDARSSLTAAAPATFSLELTKFGDNEAEVRWVIKNFSRLLEEEVESEAFYVGGVKWRIIMFPKGNFKKEKKKAIYFALYLGIDDFECLDKRVDVKLILSVVNQKYPNKCSGESQHLFAPGDEDSDWGFTQFMKLSELMNSTKGWVVDDTVIIDAEMRLLNIPNTPEQKNVLTKLMPLEELLADMKKLRSGSDPFADLTFVVDKKRIRVHRAVVMCRCPELAKYVDAIGRAEVELKQFRVGVLEMLLDYLYTDTIEFDAERILEVLQRARDLHLARLVCIAEQQIHQHLSADNVLVILTSAEELHEGTVKEMCLAFIRDHYLDVITRGTQLQQISRKHPKLMVEIAQCPALGSAGSASPSSSSSPASSSGSIPEMAAAAAAAEGNSAAGSGSLQTLQRSGGSHLSHSSHHHQQHHSAGNASSASSSPASAAGANGGVLPPSTLVADLAALWQSAAHADITFVVESEHIRAHKCILSNRCEFFARMFQGGMLEHASQQITLDLSAAAFRLVMKYLYTNTVSISLSSLDDVFHLLDLSERFLLRRLKSVCESVLKRVLDTENVVEILKCCGIYELPELKTACLQLIIKHKAHLCNKENLTGLDHGIVVELACLLAKDASSS